MTPLFFACYSFKLFSSCERNHSQQEEISESCLIYHGLLKKYVI